MPDKCPLCNDENNTTESIPISSQQAYRFEYDFPRGMTLEFFPKSKKPGPIDNKVRLTQILIYLPKV